ncbi:hypothetical protein A2572_02560 [Candidatus Collierbacteria bacterium RIFOXYD1_FULL_40_9]|uniref:Uncharacterized protein n=1 Tax=Candidatus Collierbacteria bacterium RIFOXYD1_FULL_40_9 TaxID=1817731 RepID=A0A1F5FPE7_9BACT|nr:MAG: hypothetical protein A2572_02560 [Candidatus Collierbacteria bacterium RIFOXYD1_FULL_40_9]
MAVSLDDPNAPDYEYVELHEQLVGIKGTNKKLRPVKNFHWLSYAIPVFVFIANKAIQTLTTFTSDTKTIIDIIVVISIVAGLGIYSYYLNKEK